MNNFISLNAKSILVTLFSCISFSVSASQSKENTFGTINNIPVQNSQLTPKEKSMLFEAQTNLYETAEKILEQHYLNQWFENYRLQNKLSSVAEARQVYYEKNVHVTNTEVLNFIEENKSHEELQKIPEQERTDIVRKYLERVDQVQSEKKIVALAHDQKKLKLVAIAKPKQVAVTFQVQGHIFAPKLKSPKITVVEFADYQCSYCVQADPEIIKFVTTYHENVQYIFMDLPLVDKHKEAMPAAIAAYCAGEQNQYWPMHHLIMNRTNTKKLNEELTESFAKQLNLDKKQFTVCQGSQKATQSIEGMMEEAHRVGVMGTPAIYFNGIKYDGIRSYEEMKNFADKLVNE